MKILAALVLASALLLLPMGVCGYVVVFGGEFPLGGVMIGFAVGVIAAISFGGAAAALWSSRRWRSLAGLIAVLWVVNVGWIPIGQFVNSTNSPYSRESIAFRSIEAPVVDVTGVWEGAWIDPKQGVREEIVLTLTQSDDVVSGMIVNADDRVFEVIDGRVSGDSVNLYYNVTFPEWPGLGGSLVGRVKDKEMTGTWYAHERPQRGGSVDGPWDAAYISPVPVDSVEEFPGDSE